MKNLHDMKMKDLMPEERPVEKFLSRGPAALSNGELLAIILRTGTGEENALELAQRLLLEAGGSLRSLADMDVELLRTLKGIGRKKAACLGAALELGRRFFEEGNTVSRVSVNRPEDVYRAMIPHLRGRDHEECWVLYLNAANYVICKEMESLGGSENTVLDVRRVVKKALDRKAAALILIHNHPSGNPRPGKHDISRTNDLRNALRAFNIDLLDHIIISDGCFFSFGSDALVQMQQA